MIIRKLTGFLAAELAGAHLAAAITDDTAQALRDALAAHHVIVVRGQHLSRPQQKALTRVFGELMRLPYVSPMLDDGDVIAVLKEADEVGTGVFGGEWHSDFSFLANPPAGSVLNAVEVPAVGGDTVWANQAVAYRTLPGHLRAFVDEHDAVHVGTPYGVTHAPADRRANPSIEMVRGDPEADRETVHPAVIVEPDTGERALFVNPIYTTRFDGMTAAQSAPVLAEIHRHCIRPDFGYRHRWQAGDVVVWNNRTTLHYATNDYDGFRRLLYRTTFRRSPPTGEAIA